MSEYGESPFNSGVGLVHGLADSHSYRYVVPQDRRIAYRLRVLKVEMDLRY